MKIWYTRVNGLSRQTLCKAKVSWSTPMVQSTMANGWRAIDMDLANFPIQKTTHFTKASGSPIKCMAKAPFTGQMAAKLMASLRTIWYMDQPNTMTLMVWLLRANGSTMSRTEWVLHNGPTVASMKETLRMTRKMEKEPISTQMGQSMSVIGVRASNMEMDRSSTLKVKSHVDFGRLANWSRGIHHRLRLISARTRVEHHQLNQLRL